MEKLPYRHLTTLILDVVMADILVIGAIPAGNRSIAPVRGGRFDGERLSGKVLSGGSDWIIVRADGTFSIDVRLALETGDGALIGLSYQGRFLGDRATMAAFRKGEQLDLDAYSLQAVMKFESGDERYAWLNELIAVAVGQQTPTGPIYQIYGIGR